MGLFGNPRKKIEKWAPLVMEGYTPGMPVDEEFLDAATTLYIQQHAKILYDSMHLVLTSKNEETRKSRYALAQKQFAALVRIKKYASRVQKIGLNQALNDFLNMEEMYRHPDRIPEIQRKANKRQMKQDFWDVYTQGEMMDIFTLGKTLDKNQMIKAFGIMQENFAPFMAKVTRIGLAKVNPHEDIAEFELNESKLIANGKYIGMDGCPFLDRLIHLLDIY